MSIAIYILVGGALLVAAVILLRKLVRAYWRFRGKMLVTCPETEQPVGVEVDAGYAALTTVMGEQVLQLKSCTRWPERKDCGQECLRQIELGPENCLVRTIIAEWYKGKTCGLCGREFGEIHWHDHKPAVMRLPDKKTVEWADVPVETLPAVLTTHQPVCWNCYIAETFREQHPELVVERPWKRGHLT
jgi:hypothetical protein